MAASKLRVSLESSVQKVRDTDCVSRSFCPKLSIPKDLVRGLAHCQIADYWPSMLGKRDIVAYQASKRAVCTLSPDGQWTSEDQRREALFAISEIQ